MRKCKWRTPFELTSDHVNLELRKADMPMERHEDVYGREEEVFLRLWDVQNFALERGYAAMEWKRSSKSALPRRGQWLQAPGNIGFMHALVATMRASNKDATATELVTAAAAACRGDGNDNDNGIGVATL